jgi:MFS family permease
MLSDVGFGLGPLIIGLMIPLFGLRTMYLLLAFVALACLPLYQVVHGNKKRKQVVTQTDEE